MKRSPSPGPSDVASLRITTNAVDCSSQPENISNNTKTFPETNHRLLKTSMPDDIDFTGNVYQISKFFSETNNSSIQNLYLNVLKVFAMNSNCYTKINPSMNSSRNIYEILNNSFINEKNKSPNCIALSPAVTTTDECILLIHKGKLKNSSIYPSINFLSAFKNNNNNDNFNIDGSVGDFVGDSLESNKCQTEVDYKLMMTITPTTVNAYVMRLPQWWYILTDDVQQFPRSFTTNFIEENFVNIILDIFHLREIFSVNELNRFLIQNMKGALQCNFFPIKNMICKSSIDTERTLGTGFNRNSLNSFLVISKQNKLFDCQERRAAISEIFMDFRKQRNEQISQTASPTNILKITNTPAMPTIMTESTDLVVDTKYGHDDVQQQQETQVHRVGSGSGSQDRSSNSSCVVVFAHDGISNGNNNVRPTKTAIIDNILNRLPQNIKEYRSKYADRQAMLPDENKFEKITHPVHVEMSTFSTPRRLYAHRIYRTDDVSAFPLIPSIIIAKLPPPNSSEEKTTLISIEHGANFSNSNVSLNTPTTASIDDEHHNARPDFGGLEQQPFARRFYSDVRDTSLQEVLVDTARAKVGTCPPSSNLGIKTTKAKTLTTTTATFQSVLLLPATASPSKSSDFVAVQFISSLVSPSTSSLSHYRLSPTKASTFLPSPLQSPPYDELPNFELLLNCCTPEHNRTELDEWIDLVDRSITKTENRATTLISLGLPILNCQSLQTRYPDKGEQKEKKRKERKKFSNDFAEVETEANIDGLHRKDVDVEMTITTIEEYEEEGDQLRSELSSPVSGLIGGQRDNNFTADPFDEMKFEMLPAKGALPSTVHDRLKSSIPNNTTRNYPTHNPSSVTRSQSTTLASTHGLPKTLQSQLPTRYMLPERLSSRQAVNVVSDLTARAESPVSRSVSVDTISMDSTSPSRTRFRRQRRMYSQDSTEQPEDPIERLNRLRARISGALSEVKGVLNKYSTETEPNETSTVTKETANTTVLKRESPPREEGPVQFRFVRKVRRRSIFNEEDEAPDKVKDQLEKNVPQTSDMSKLPTEPEKQNTETRNTEENLEKHRKIDMKEPPPVVVLPKIEEQQIKIPEVARKKVEKKEVLKIITAEKKHATRRASFGAPENKDSKTLLSKIKTQRRPSDSAAILKGQQIFPKNNFLERKEASNIAVENEENPEPIAATTAVETLITAIDKRFSEKEKLQQSTGNIKAEATHTLETVPTPKSAQTTKPKTRVSVKHNSSLRRASIAAVEESKIESVQANKPLEVKAQRRPSDSAALLKKKSEVVTAPTLIVKTNTTTKIKRPSVKNGTAACGQNVKALLDTKYCHKDDARVSKAPKQPVIEATPSIAVIHDETPITSSPKSVQSMATVIGMPTNATSTTISPITKNTQINDIAKNSNDHNVVKSASPINTANEANNQSELSNDHQKSRGAITVSSTPDVTPPINNIASKYIELKTAPATFVVLATQSLEPLSANNAINQVNIVSKKSEKFLPDNNTVDLETENTKKFIHQQKNKTTLQPPSQQVSISNIAQIVDTNNVEKSTVNVKEIENSETTAKKSLSEVKKTTSDTERNQSLTTSDTPATVVAAKNIESITVTKGSNAAIEHNSTVQTTTEGGSSLKAVAAELESEPSLSQASKAEINSKPTTPTSNQITMPELQVSPAPVKAVQLHPHIDSKVSAPFNVLKEEFPKKKIIIKKIVRKNSTEKQPNKTTNEKVEPVVAAAAAAAAAAKIQQDYVETPSVIQTELTDEIVESTIEITPSVDIIPTTTPPTEPSEPLVPTKKPRKVKKRVIIKRQKRKLSISDSTFFSQEPSLVTINNEDVDVETLEKAIAYVTDSEDEKIEEPIKPLKPCIRPREYHIGDLVMYAERFKKTQVRWKKGRVLDRITSISYKLEIDGKEVAAHISYIKRFTDRKVNFGGKEYLEIDYEQIAEQEERARNYSIWNMV